MKYLLILFSLLTSGICLSQSDTSGNKTLQVDQRPFTIVERMPSFPGDNDAMGKFIKSNLKYPKGQKFDGPNTCYVTMVVEKDGSLTDIKVLRSAQGGPAFDQEAIRVISLMPKWNPGSQNGHLVRVQYNLPVKFIK